MLRQRGIRLGGDLGHEARFLGGPNRPGSSGRPARGQIVGSLLLLAPPAETRDIDVNETGDLSRGQARRQGPQRPLTEVDGVRARHTPSASPPCQRVNLFAIRSSRGVSSRPYLQLCVADVHGGESDLRASPFRGILSVTFVGFATYATAESRNHRKRESAARSTELKLRAFDPYIAALKVKDRHRLKIESTRHIFMSSEDDKQGLPLEPWPYEEDEEP